MSSNFGRRTLEIERLADRLAFSVQEFLSLDSPLGSLSLNSLPDLSSQQVYRQVSFVADNRIQTIGLHPQGNQLVNHSQAFELPAGAVDAVVDQALDADSSLGFAVFSDGRTEAVLWVTPELPVLLGSAEPLAAYQRPDQTIDLVLESGVSIRVVRFSASGVELNSILLDGSKYSQATASADGIAIFGTENDKPLAAKIDEQFVVQEIELAMPTGATFAVPIGLNRWHNTIVYSGSAIDSTGETRVVKWNLQGELIDQNPTVDIWALKSSGQAMLVDTEQGAAIMVHDSAIASLLGIQANLPTTSTQLAILQGRGFTETSLTELVERNGEIFIGVIGTNSSGDVVHGVIVSSLNQFPSPWKNPFFPEDVNQSNTITPTDALLIINELNSQGGRLLTADDLGSEHRIDVNGTGSISPVDALLVINLLNNRNPEGEAEASLSLLPYHHPLIEISEEIRKRLRA